MVLEGGQPNVYVRLQGGGGVKNTLISVFVVCTQSLSYLYVISLLICVSISIGNPPREEECIRVVPVLVVFLKGRFPMS